MDNLIINLESFKEVGIYGYSSAGWNGVERLARQKATNVYDYTASGKLVETLSGRTLTQFRYIVV